MRRLTLHVHTARQRRRSTAARRGWTVDERDVCIPRFSRGGIRNKDSRKESCVALRYEINSSLGGGDEVIASRLNFLDA